MSARAVAVIRPAANIIARLAFLCILSGQGQLHAYRDESKVGSTPGLPMVRLGMRWCLRASSTAVDAISAIVSDSEQTRRPQERFD